MSDFPTELTATQLGAELTHALRTAKMVNPVRITSHGKPIATIVSPSAGDMLDFLRGDQTCQEGFAEYLSKQKPEMLETMLDQMDRARLKIAIALHGGEQTASHVEKLAARTNGAIGRAAGQE